MLILNQIEKKTVKQTDKLPILVLRLAPKYNDEKYFTNNLYLFSNKTCDV